MALIEEEEELFGLNEAEEVINLSGSEAEEQYDDDDGDGRHSHPEGQGAKNEVPDANSAKIVKPKRVIKNPQPKLDVARLCGPRGIGIVQKCLSSAPYRGKGYEAEDLALLLQRLQHWAHRLYPRLPFNDTIAQIEKLGNKKALQVNVKRLRMDMYETPVEGDAEVKDDAMDVGDAEVAAADAHDDEPDVFDELLRQSGAPLMGLRDSVTSLATGGTMGASGISSQPVSAVSVVLTEEQKARMERNKQLALERRRARLAEDSAVTTLNDAAAGVKRRRSDAGDDDDDDDDRPVPTQAELRELREGLLINVMSQSSVGTACEVAGRDPVFDGEFDDTDMDAVLDVLNRVESNDAVLNKSICLSSKNAENSGGNNANEDQLNKSVADELSSGEDVNDYECEKTHNSTDRRQSKTESPDLCAKGALSVTTEPLSSSNNTNDIANVPDAERDLSTTRQSLSGLDVIHKTVVGAAVNDESLDATSKTASGSVISDKSSTTQATEASLTVSATDALVKNLSAGESDLAPTCSSDLDDNAATAVTSQQESDGTFLVTRVCDDRDAEDGLSDMQVDDCDVGTGDRDFNDQEVNKGDVADQVVDDKTTDEQDVSR